MFSTLLSEINGDMAARPVAADYDMDNDWVVVCQRDKASPLSETMLLYRYNATCFWSWANPEKYSRPNTGYPSTSFWTNAKAKAFCASGRDPLAGNPGMKVVPKYAFACPSRGYEALWFVHPAVWEFGFPHFGCDIRQHQIRIFTEEADEENSWLDFGNTPQRERYRIVPAENRMGTADDEYPSNYLPGGVWQTYPQHEEIRKRREEYLANKPVDPK